MDYIDTSVVLSRINPNDANHPSGMRLIEQSRDMVVSAITLLEMKSVFSRTTKLTEEEIEAYLRHVDEIGIESKIANFNRVFTRALEISFCLKMKTLDVLHLAACLEIGAEVFVSLDQEFESRAREISNLGITVRTSRDIDL
ncbi:MAG: type II toxin-antitoxin system VapC family toxin [Thermoplasmata archaeon]|nr:type II toxin-antitoxin system VapC family toxin [Candidatus Sysuiplasma acidicola]MBX8646778.1 type II toxin-antitoxin system VapC family toxin [Candidatus Sysuiplasma acidicola]